MPLRLSAHGVVTSHAALSLKNQCAPVGGCYAYVATPDITKKVPYYSPHFYVTSRALVMGPGDQVLCIFPTDELLVCMNDHQQVTTKPDLTWCLQLTVGTKKPLVINRNTPLENILTIPGMETSMAAVTVEFMQHLRQEHADYLQPPTPSILHRSSPLTSTSMDDLRMSHTGSTLPTFESEEEEEEEGAEEEEEDTGEAVMDEETKTTTSSVVPLSD